MTRPLLALTQRISELPPEQAAVMVPIFAWLLLLQAPATARLPPSLAAEVESLIEELGPDESRWVERLEERLLGVGLTSALLRELASTARAEAPSPPLLTSGSAPSWVEPRVEPSPGQVRNGPLAAFELRRGR